MPGIAVENKQVGCRSVQFSPVPQSCLTLWDPMDCNMPGLPVHHQLPEFTKTHIYWVRDAMQPSHPVPTHSPAFNLSQHEKSMVCSNESVLRIRGPKYWNFSFSIVLPMNIQDWFPFGWTGWSPCCPRDSQESSPTPQFKSTNSSALSFLHSPTLLSKRDYWKNHSFD